MEFDLTRQGTEQALQYMKNLKDKLEDVDKYRVMALIRHESQEVQNFASRILVPYLENDEEVRHYFRGLLRDPNLSVVALAQEIVYPGEVPAVQSNDELDVHELYADAQTLSQPEVKQMATKRTKNGSSDDLEARLVNHRSNFIIVPDTGVMISRGKLFENLNWYDSHYALASNGLYMPTPHVWMRHYQQVIKAKQSGSILLDENLNEINLKSEEFDETYKNIINTFIWLDAFFKNGNLTTNNRAKITNKVTQSGIHGITEPIISCLTENCFARLGSLNSQGLPTEKSAFKYFIPGNNIYFEGPTENPRAAWFVSHSERASIVCHGIADAVSFNLGVFGCKDNRRE